MTNDDLDALMPSDPTSDLVDAMHAYLDAGGDVDSMIDMARMVAKERGDE